jgi:hypothetical protein
MKTIISLSITLLLFISYTAMSQNFSFKSYETGDNYMDLADNNNFFPNPVNHGAKSDSSSSEISNSCEDYDNAVSGEVSEIKIKKNYFAIEQSINASDFMQVGVVITGGSSCNVLDYSVNDDNACNTIFYYRISNIDIEDSEQVTHIKWMKIDDDKISGIAAYPNPVGTELYIRLERNTLYKVTINTPDERMFSEQVYSDEKGILKPGISYMPDGVYLINIDDGAALFSFLFLKR